MLFKDVIGQEEIKERLIASAQSGRVSHAQLFAGSTGAGTLALALALTQYLLCTGEKRGDACGTCPECRKMQKLIHPDVHFVFPVVKSAKAKSPVSDEYAREWREMLLRSPYVDMEDWLAAMGADENAQALIYTEESGNILRKLSLKSFESEYKVMIIWQPEKMNPECANKLLKILEEPYPNTVFLLVAERPEAMLKTILSRAQRVNVPPLSQGDIADELVARKRLTREAAEEAAHVAAGSWLKAVRMLEETEEDAYNQEKFVQMMRLCWERKMLPVNEFVNEIASLGREREKSFLAHCLRMLRENFARNFGIDRIVYMTGRERQFSTRFSPYVHEGNIARLYEEFERAYGDVTRNGNGKIIFTDLCIKVMQNIRP